MLCILVVKMSLLLVSKQSSLTKQERIHDPEREAEIFYILPSIEKYKKKYVPGNIFLLGNNFPHADSITWEIIN